MPDGADTITTTVAERDLESCVMIACSVDRPAQILALNQLVTRTYPSSTTLKVYRRLLAEPNGGARLALEYIGRMPEPIPPAVRLLAAQALQNRSFPSALRLIVAGKLLASVADSQASVGPIVRSLTAGMSRSRTLERMLQLQSRVDSCETLDQMVRTGLSRVKLKCPRCTLKLSRSALVKHLWHQHRLVFTRGMVRDNRTIVEDAVAEAAMEQDSAAVDRAFDATKLYFPDATPRQVLQATAARQPPPVPTALLTAAREERAGLCPTCLCPVPISTPGLLPALALGNGRLAGEGYAVRVVDSAAGRSILVESPNVRVRVAATSASRLGPRGFGVLVASLLSLGLFALVAVMPDRRVNPIAAAVVGSMLVWLIYVAGRLIRPPLLDANDLAVDIAWGELTPASLRTRDATSFLMRLCRVSFDIGSPGDRLPRLKAIEERIVERENRTPLDAQLLASTRVLRVCDGGTLGKDRLAGLLNVFEPFFQVDPTAPATYAEAAAEVLLTCGQLTPSDQRRLAVLVIGLAFDCTLTPLALASVLRYLPWLRRLLQSPDEATLRFAYVVWRGRQSEPWATVGRATTLLELARAEPGASRRILYATPDAVLRIDLSDAVERILGDVVLTARGLNIQGAVISDPDTPIDVVRSPHGAGWQLTIGTLRLPLERKLPSEVLPQIQGWLRYRVSKMLPAAEQANLSKPERVARLLGSELLICPLCHTRCLCQAGEVGVTWPPK